MTIKQILNLYPYKYHISKLEVQILLSFILKKPKEYLIMYPEYILNTQELANLDKYCTKRSTGYPIAYITGVKEFYSLDFIVTPDVLIPRPETEFLVLEAINKAKNNDNILDLGTGSGIIPICIAKYKNVNIFASDISTKALEVAQINALKHQVKINFVHSNWFDAFDKLTHSYKFDIITSNPPYIHSKDEHLDQNIKFEPRNALTDEQDGLMHIRHIIHTAPKFMHKQAYLILEHGYNQAKPIKELLAKQYKNIYHIKDLNQIDRITVAQIDN